MAGDEVQKSAESVGQKIDHTKLTPEQKEEAKRGYSEWVKDKGHNLYESWIPWVEDQYLSWFTKDNKASYATKQQLDKTKVTGIEGVDNLQDGLNSVVSGQLGKGGLLQPLGDVASKEGINRTEREGKDDKGSYASGPLGTVANPVAGGAKSAASGANSAAQSGANTVTEGTKGTSGYVGGAGSYVSSGASSVGSSVKGAGSYVGTLWKGGQAKESDDTTSGGDDKTPAGPQDTPSDVTKQAQAAPEQAAGTAQQGVKQGADTVHSGAQQTTGTAQSAAKTGGEYATNAGDAVGSGVKGAGGYVGGFLGGEKK